MNPTTTTTRMTADEFYEWCCRPENDNKRFELVRGEVIELPVPTKPHGVICVKISTAIEMYCMDRGKGYVAGNDSGVILERDPDTVRGPDVAYYEDAETFEELHPKYGENPPRVAVEVLSPEDRPGKVMRKIADYLNAGVPLVWVVDPEDQSVTVHRPDRPPTVLTRDQDLSGEDVLPGFQVPIARFFRLSAEQKTTPPAQ